MVLRGEYPNCVLAAAAVIAEADALVSTSLRTQLCQTIRATLDGRQVLPTTVPAMAADLWRLTAARFVVLRDDAELRRIAATGPAPDAPA